MPKKPVPRIALLLTALSLAACAHCAPFHPVAKEKATMNSASQTVQPRLTAEQGLLRLLELIRTSQVVTDITPERVSAVMGVPLTPDFPKDLWFREVLTPQWRHVLSTPKKFDPSSRGYETSLNYGFGEIPSGSAPPMTGLCQPDFDRFTAELEAMGFARGSEYDSLPPAPPTGWPPDMRGRRMFDIFERPDIANGLRIEVYPEGEADEPSEKVTHLCVKDVLIY